MNGGSPRSQPLVRIALPLLVASIALRPPLNVVGALAGRLEHELSASHAAVGLVGTALLLQMGLCSFIAPALLTRLGARTVVTAGLGLAGVAQLARAGSSSVEVMIALTVPVGIGIGVAGATLPSTVATLFGSRAPTGTGVHAVGINTGAAVAAFVAAPLAQTALGWRGTLAVVGFVAIVGAAIWSTSAQAANESQPVRTARRGCRGTGMLTLVFTLQALCFYALSAWLPDAYAERGWSETASGALVGVVTLASLPASLAAPLLAARLKSTWAPLLVGAAAVLVGAAALAVAPATAWGAAAVTGNGLGMLFAVCLLSAVLHGDSQADARAATAVMLGTGYLAAASAPVALGALRDAAGSFSSALLAVGGAAALLAVVVAFGRRTLEAYPQGEDGPEH